MVCSSKHMRDTHCFCTEVTYPYRREALSNEVQATRLSNCTINPGRGQDQKLSFEKNMDLINLDDFRTYVPDAAVFGTYCNMGKSNHFCVDKGRRTVDGRRLSWLWIFKNGKPGGSNKNNTDPPKLIWTKKNIMDAYAAAGDNMLPMFTRHVELYPELAITFCLTT